MRILVLDDDSGLRRTVSLLLEDEGHVVRGVAVIAHVLPPDDVCRLQRSAGQGLRLYTLRRHHGDGRGCKGGC